MSDGDRGHLPVETPVNPYSLLEAVNASSDTVNTGWLIFLALMTYVLVAVAGVTHKDLLLETPVALPILQVSIQLKQFFTFAPIIIVLFHLGIIAQLVLLARKTLAFDHAVRLLESGERRTHPLRLELHNFFFVQAIAGPHRSRVVSVFLHGMSWMTTVILPVVLLLYIQVAFLPYHEIPTTWVHRIALLVDLGVLFLIGTFLLSSETSFFQALTRNARTHPFNVSVTTAVLLFAGFLSFFVATVPGERLDQTAQLAFGAPKPDLARERANASDSPWPFALAGTNGSLFGMFRRNLLVTDADLVSDKDVRAGDSSLNLRGRDLRYARFDRSDLHQADMTGANISDASFEGADLRGAVLHCGNLDEMILTDNRAAARCVMARNVNFGSTNLEGVRLAGADLRGANFLSADITGGDLSYTLATGANFRGAKLDRADMTGVVHAEGASFLYASMQGADLTGAQLQGAELSSANLQGAVLSFAHLEGATLGTADLEGASLHRARLQGADLTGAKVKAADFRGATVWMTLPPEADASGLADFRELQINPLDEQDQSGLQMLNERLRGEREGERVRDRLEAVMTGKDNGTWSAGEAFAAWTLLEDAGTEPPDALAGRLTEYLAGMMCRARGPAGAVATGIVRRAQSQQFVGNAGLIYERSKRDDCLAARFVPDTLLRGLATVAEAGKGS